MAFTLQPEDKGAYIGSPASFTVAASVPPGDYANTATVTSPTDLHPTGHTR